MPEVPRWIRYTTGVRTPQTQSLTFDSVQTYPFRFDRELHHSGSALRGTNRIGTGTLGDRLLVMIPGSLRESVPFFMRSKSAFGENLACATVQ